MHGTIPGLIESFGYPVLFLLVGLESFGIPLPGETALVTAAAFAASGRLSIIGVIAAAAAGAILGDNGGYWVGRKGGLALVRRYGRVLHLNESHIDRARGFFERYGARAVFIGRFVALLRTWAAVLAGAAHMPYRTFTIYNALGGLVWAALFGGLGYAFGRNLPQLEHYVGQASLVVVLLAALVVVLVIVSRRTARGGAPPWQTIAVSPAVRRVTERHPGLRAFIIGRFARGEFVGLYLTVGLLVSLGALWLFGGITEDVVHHDPLTLFDVAVLQWFRAHATPLGDRAAVFISDLGSPAAMAALGVAVVGFLAVRRRWLQLSGWAAALIGAGVLGQALKFAVRRARPASAALYLHDFSYSFPSGHALGSLAGYGMLSYLIIRATRDKTRRVAIVLATIVLVTAIGLSRLYLGVHYFSDVLAGYAAAIVWLWVCISAVELATRTGSARSSNMAA